MKRFVGKYVQAILLENAFLSDIVILKVCNDCIKHFFKSFYDFLSIANTV